MVLLGKKKNIVIICMANITRSPYVAGLLKKELKQRRAGGRQFRVVSAGMHVHPGNPADPVLTMMAERHGFSLKAHRANPLQTAIAQNAYLMFTMDEEQKSKICQMFPEQTERIFTLQEFGANGDSELNGSQMGIMDPTGKEPEAYRQFDRIAQDCVQRIVNELMLATD
jgi:protein-tyrosine phosphatase